MKDGKNSDVLIVFVVFVVGALGFLGGYLICNQKDEKCVSESKEITKESKYTVEKVAGSYRTNFNYELDGKKTNGSITLKLYKDGTFSHRFYGAVSGYGVIGNYVISDGKVVLNDLFTTGSSTSVEPTKGTRTLTINADGSLSDSNAIGNDESGVKEVKLIGISDDSSNEFTKYFNGLNEFFEQ